jgi:hypothetical protein
MYILYFVAAAFLIACLCFFNGGPTNGSMIFYGSLIWVLATLFDKILPNIFGLPVAAPKGRVDFVYYTLSIFGIVLLFVAQDVQRQKDKLESQREAEQTRQIAAANEIERTKREIEEGASALPDAIRSAAAKELNDFKLIMASACACANQLPGSGCEPYSRSPSKPGDEVIIQLKRTQADHDCEYLMNDKSNDFLEEISREQDRKRLQALVETHPDELKLDFGRYAVTGRQAVKILNDPDYRRQYVERQQEMAKREYDEASSALETIKKQKAAYADIENPHGGLNYAMDAYWPVFLLIGVGLKLSQSGLSVVTTF